MFANEYNTFSGLTVTNTATASVRVGCTPGVGLVTICSNATLEVAGCGTVALGGNLALADGACLGFNFTERQTVPLLDVTDRSVTFGSQSNVVVKVSAADGVRAKSGANVLTSGGKFAGANVTLADGYPDWVKGVSVVDGEIVLDAKQGGLILFVR